MSRRALGNTLLAPAGRALVVLVVASLTGAPGAGAQPLGPVVGPNVPVTPTDLVSRTAHNSPLVVADPTRPHFVVLANRLDGPDFSCALQVSNDGGNGWLSADPVPELPAGADKCYAPEVAFDREGRLYYLFVGLSGGGNSPMGAFITTSDDRARTFSAPRQVLGPERYQVRMALDPTLGDNGRLHLVWLEATTDPPLGGLPPPPNPIRASHSDDGGRSFSAPVQVNDQHRRLAVAPALALGPDHRVHVLYYDLGDDVRDYQGLEGPTWDGRWSLVTTTSSDDGLTFPPGTVVDAELVPPERVMLVYTMPPASLAADASGSVYVSWHDARNGDWDVFLRRSTDGGRSWGPPARLNDDGPGNGRHQYLPRLSVAPDGRIDAAFYDRRDDPENRGNDVFFTHSVDGGTSFATNLRLTSRGFDPAVGPRYSVPSAQGLNEFGSRIALWSRPASALVAWTDTRNTARAFPAQDIFAASVSLSGAPYVVPDPAAAPGPGGSGGGPVGTWPLWAAAAVAVGTALVFAVTRRRGRASARGAPG